MKCSFMHAERLMLYPWISKLTHFIHSKGETWFLFWKSPSISIHIGPAVSFTLGWVGDVPGIKQYVTWFQEQTRTTHFLILWVFLISTQLLLNNYSVDSQLNFLSYILDWTSESLFLISFLKWGGNILAPGIVTPCSSCVIGQLFQDFSSFYKFLYLVLSTCLLRFLVSFVENACHLKIFKWFLDFYVLKMPCDWGT